MKDLTPLKEFKMTPGADDDGVLRWMHGEHGFEFALIRTLETLTAQYFDKADWEPTISHVLMEASEIIGSQEWPAELGFGAFDKFSEEILSSGAQADTAGMCISSMNDFMATKKKRSKDLNTCIAEVAEKTETVKKQMQRGVDMETLNTTIGDYEFAEDEEDTRLALEPVLKGLLHKHGYADDLDTPDGLR